MFHVPALKLNIAPETLEDAIREFSKKDLDELTPRLLGLVNKATTQTEVTTIEFDNTDILLVVDHWMALPEVQEEFNEDDDDDYIARFRSDTSDVVTMEYPHYEWLKSRFNVKFLVRMFQMVVFTADSPGGKKNIIMRPDFPQIFNIIYWDIVRWYLYQSTMNEADNKVTL